MKRVIRIAIVTTIVVSAGTAAFAIAETGRYPGAKQIPTVVASPSATANGFESLPRNIGVSALPGYLPNGASAPKGGKSAILEAIASDQTANTPSSAVGSDDEHETVREVVTHEVRDNEGESSSARAEDGAEESKEASSDSDIENSREIDEQH